MAFPNRNHHAMTRSIRNQFVPTKISLLQATLSTISFLFTIIPSLSLHYHPLAFSSLSSPRFLFTIIPSLSLHYHPLAFSSLSSPRFLFTIILYDKYKCSPEHHQFDGESVCFRGERDKSRRSR